MKILICGLPGSGKTTLAIHLKKILNAVHLNADEVREKFNDWDFSEEGRRRQASRMRKLSDEQIKLNNIVIADFVCPTERLREDFNADYVIYMDTIKEGRYENTNRIFKEPNKYNIKVNFKDAKFWTSLIKIDLINNYKICGVRENEMG